MSRPHVSAGIVETGSLMTGRLKFAFSCQQFSCPKRFESDIHHTPAGLQPAFLINEGRTVMMQLLGLRQLP